VTEQPAQRAGDARVHDFHRFYLDQRIEGQLAYYRARRAEYRDAHRQAVVVRNALLFLAAVVGGVGAFVPGGRAGLGVAAALLGAFAAAVTAYETLIGFSQLEKRYADALHNLEEAALDWRDLDPAADHTAEVERVKGVFRSERGQWGQLVVKSAAPVSPQPVPKPPTSPPAPG
jgi:hypothetical protein